MYSEIKEYRTMDNRIKFSLKIWESNLKGILLIQNCNFNSLKEATKRLDEIKKELGGKIK